MVLSIRIQDSSLLVGVILALKWRATVERFIHGAK